MRLRVLGCLLLLLFAWPGAAHAQEDLVIEPKWHDFGWLTADEIDSAILEVWNDGSGPVTLDRVGFLWGEFGPYALNDGGCAPGVVLDPGWGCEMEVTFTAPTVHGDYAAVVFVEADGGVKIASARVDGSSLPPEFLPPPQLVAEPGALDFGTAPREATGAEQAIVVRNMGNSTAAFADQAPRLGGPRWANFGLRFNGCLALLSPGEECTIGITFKPLTDGLSEARLDLHLLSGAVGLTIPLRGMGPAPPLAEPLVDLRPTRQALTRLARAVPGVIRGGSRRPLHLPAYAPPVSGRLSLEIRGVGQEGRSPRLATGALALTQGSSGRLRFSLTRKARKLLRRPRKTTIEVSVAFDPDSATYGLLWKKLTLTVRPPAKPRAAR